jgi:hypothetical protein
MITRSLLCPVRCCCPLSCCLPEIQTVVHAEKNQTISHVQFNNAVGLLIVVAAAVYISDFARCLSLLLLPTLAEECCAAQCANLSDRQSWNNGRQQEILPPGITVLSKFFFCMKGGQKSMGSGKNLIYLNQLWNTNSYFIIGMFRLAI